MAEWFATAPVALAALLVLCGPGMAPSYALGLRGLVAWGAAPMISVAIVGTTAVVLGALGLPWGTWGVLVGTGVCIGAAWAAGVVAQRYRSATDWHRRWPWWVTVGLGVGIGIAWQLRRLMAAVGAPDHIAQTFDSPFHLNAVAYILDRGDASSLHMNLTSPAASSGFYPSAWHALVSWVVQLTGTSIPVATTWVGLVTVGVVWPLGMLAFARVLFGARPVMLALTVPVAFTLTQFPNRLFSFGILYPNILSYALVPGALALGALGLLRVRGRRRVPALTGLALGMVGVLWAQPNGVFTVLVLLLPAAVLAAVRTVSWRRRRGATWVQAFVPPGIVIVAGVLAVAVASRIPMLAQFAGRTQWEVATDWRHATAEAWSLTAMHPSLVPNFPAVEIGGWGTPNPMAVFVVAGLVASCWVRRWRWLPSSYLLVVGLYVLVRGVDLPLRGALTGFWYADPQRIAAMLPLIGVPLAVVGVVLPVHVAARWLTARRGLGGTARQWSVSRVGELPALAASCVVLVVVVLLIPRSAHFRESLDYVAGTYGIDENGSDPNNLLDRSELDLFDEVAREVPPGVTVVGNPWTGSSLVWALTDREAIFPHTGMNLDANRELVKASLVDAGTDPRVCAAVDALDIGYVIVSDTYLWGWNTSEEYRGLQGLEQAGVAREVARVGSDRLLQLTACGGPSAERDRS